MITYQWWFEGRGMLRDAKWVFQDKWKSLAWEKVRMAQLGALKFS